MRIRIALTLLILLSLGKSQAFPMQQNINNQEQLAPKVQTAPVVVQETKVDTIKSEAPTPTPQTVPVQVSETPPTSCGDNVYAHYIYMHESSCRLDAVNSIGCRGLGQACPGTKLPCGNDYVCQNNWFTNYANQRYGSWYNAYVFWLSNHWW